MPILGSVARECLSVPATCVSDLVTFQQKMVFFEGPIIYLRDVWDGTWILIFDFTAWDRMLRILARWRGLGPPASIRTRCVSLNICRFNQSNSRYSLPFSSAPVCRSVCANRNHSSGHVPHTIPYLLLQTDHSPRSSSGPRQRPCPMQLAAVSGIVNVGSQPPSGVCKVL
jgi:hypothetical protein